MRQRLAKMFSFSARHAVEVIRRLVSAGIGPPTSSWTTFPPIQSGQSSLKKTALLLRDVKTNLTASNIFTPGLNYCTAQRSVLSGSCLFASAFLSQLSCLSGRCSSDAMACKHNCLSLCLAAEQLNQQ